MKMKFWKRNAVVAAIVLFVCTAVYLNWSYNRQIDKTASGGKKLGEAALVDAKSSDPLLDTSGEGGQELITTGYFSSARLNRQQSRDSALDLLQQAAADEKASQEAIDKANEAIRAMASYTMTEAQIENLISAKGYSDCIAFLSDHSISVVVAATKNGLTDADIAKISDIVIEQTGFRAGQIKIIQANP